jgi:hypothetical protein
MSRQERDRHGGGAEQEKRDRQFDAAAMHAIDPHEDGGADRPCDKSQREDREGIKRAGQRIDAGKDEFREDHDRGDGIYEKVEELRRAPDHDADHDFAGAHASAVSAWRAGVLFKRR